MSSTAYLETRILSADPIELVQILYEHAILAVQEARRQLTAGDIAARSRAVSKCVAILGELEGCLDHKTGGTLSQELARLYSYLQGQLTLGNFQQTDAPFEVVESVLLTLAEGWKAVGALPAEQAAPQPEYSGAGNNPWGCGPVPEAVYGRSGHSWCA
jgi:flagellar secretion chaperone FliS